MATQPSNFITPEEYLRRERAAPSKSEYYRGAIFAMAGASEAHNSLVVNLISALVSRLRGSGCRVYPSDMRLFIPATELYTYPDVSVVCGMSLLADEHNDILLNPTIIVEVLSKSTQDYDRGGKFHQYMSIPSLQEYLTVSQTEMLVDQSIRQPNGDWLVREIRPVAAKVSLASLNIDLPLSDIYEDVKLHP